LLGWLLLKITPDSEAGKPEALEESFKVKYT